MPPISPLATSGAASLDFFDSKAASIADHAGTALETASLASRIIANAFYLTTMAPTALAWSSRVKDFSSFYKEAKKLFHRFNIYKIFKANIASKNAAKDLSFSEVQIHGDDKLGSKLIDSIDRKLLKAFSNPRSEKAEKTRKYAAIKLAIKEHKPFAQGSLEWKSYKKEILVFYEGKHKREAFLEKVGQLLNEIQNTESRLFKEVLYQLGDECMQEKLLEAAKDLKKEKIDPDFLKTLLKAKYGDKLISTIDTYIADLASCKRAVIQSGIRNYEKHLGKSLGIKERQISKLERHYLEQEKLVSQEFKFKFRCLQLVTGIVSSIALPVLLRIPLASTAILMPFAIASGVLELGLCFYKTQKPETPLLESLKHSQ